MADKLFALRKNKLNTKAAQEQPDEQSDEDYDEQERREKSQELADKFFERMKKNKLNTKAAQEQPDEQSDEETEVTQEQPVGLGAKLNAKSNNNREVTIKNTKKSIKILPKTDKCNDETQQKKKHNLIINSNCVRTMELTPVWRAMFPSRTSWIAWDNKKNPGCNFNLLKYILRTHDCKNYEKLDISNVKKMLIQFYNKYISGGENDETTKQLHAKWKKEGKSHLWLQRTSIENIIEDENYFLSKTDVVLIAFELNLPITMLYEFKGEVKITSFQQENNPNVKYFVKIASRSNQLYLAARAKSIIFEESDLSKEFQRKINEKKLANFYEYLSSK